MSQPKSRRISHTHDCPVDGLCCFIAVEKYASKPHGIHVASYRLLMNYVVCTWARYPKAELYTMVLKCSAETGCESLLRLENQA